MLVALSVLVLLASALSIIALPPTNLFSSVDEYTLPPYDGRGGEPVSLYHLIRTALVSANRR